MSNVEIKSVETRYRKVVSADDMNKTIIEALNRASLSPGKFNDELSWVYMEGVRKGLEISGHRVESIEEINPTTAEMR